MPWALYLGGKNVYYQPNKGLVGPIASMNILLLVGFEPLIVQAPQETE
jgi:hypothetical protein